MDEYAVNLPGAYAYPTSALLIVALVSKIQHTSPGPHPRFPTTYLSSPYVDIRLLSRGTRRRLCRSGLLGYWTILCLGIPRPGLSACTQSSRAGVETSTGINIDLRLDVYMHLDGRGRYSRISSVPDKKHSWEWGRKNRHDDKRNEGEIEEKSATQGKRNTELKRNVSNTQ